MRLMVRDLLGEDSAANWSDALINRFINRAAKEVYAQILQANEEYFATSGDITYVAAQQLYDLPNSGNVAKVLLVERIDSANKINLVNIPLVRKNDFQTTDMVLPTGNERWFLAGTKIGFAPAPTSALTNAVRVWYVPPLADLGADANTFSVDWTDLHHEVVVWGAFLRCLVRDKEAYAQFSPNFERLWSLLVADMEIRQTQEPQRVIPNDDLLY